MLLLGALGGVIASCSSDGRSYLLDDERSARSEPASIAAGRPVPMPEEVSPLRASPDDERPAAALEDLEPPRDGIRARKENTPMPMPEEPPQGRSGE
jgi:hypothetical protein